MHWLACSPDLNLIENLWDQLGQMFQKRLQPVDTLADVQRCVRQGWAWIAQRRVTKFINGMRKWCQACLDSRGGHTSTVMLLNSRSNFENSE